MQALQARLALGVQSVTPPCSLAAPGLPTLAIAKGKTGKKTKVSAMPGASVSAGVRLGGHSLVIPPLEYSPLPFVMTHDTFLSLCGPIG